MSCYFRRPNGSGLEISVVDHASEHHALRVSFGLGMLPACVALGGACSSEPEDNGQPSPGLPVAGGAGTAMGLAGTTGAAGNTTTGNAGTSAAGTSGGGAGIGAAGSAGGTAGS